MASPRFCSPTGALEKIPTSCFCSNPRMSTSFHCNNKDERRVSRMTAKATGAPKYKGTQMREKLLTEMIEKKVIEAKEICKGEETSDKCKVAWDEVEEISQAKADLRLRLELEERDPLEFFCQDNPETEECRIYE